MVKVPNGNANNEVNRKIILIDRKLKDAFSNVKNDIKSIKESLEKRGNIDKKELNSYISDFEKNINVKIKKIEEEFLQKKFEKEDVDSKLSSFKSFLLNNLKDIKREIKKTKQPDKRSKVLPYLKKQIEYFRSKLEKSRQKTLLYKLKLKQEKKIQKLIEKFSSDKGKKEESVYENSLINQLEWYKDRYGHIEKQQKDIENLKRYLESEYKKDRIKLEKEKKDIVNSYEKKLDLIEISNKQYQQFIINRIEESQKNFNEILSNNEEKFEKIIKDLDKKRQEDNIFLLKQFSSLSKEKEKKEEKIIRKKEELTIFKKKKISFLNITPYIFLILLALIAVNQFFKFDFVTKNMTIFVILAIAFGIVVFWHNRKKVEFEIDKEKKDEEFKEEIKKREFPFKFPNLNKIPILRNIVKWMYKEGWVYSVGLLVVIILGFVLRIWNLDYLYPIIDEYSHLVAAKRFMIEGIFNYPRTSFLSHIIGYLFIINKGTSLFLARLPSVIIGTSSIFLIYFFGKKLNKKIGLICSYLLAFSPLAVGMSRYIREYEFYLFLLIVALLIIIPIAKNLYNKPKKYLIYYTLFVFILLSYYFLVERAIIMLEIFVISLIFIFIFNLETIFRKRNLIWLLVGLILFSLFFIFFSNIYSGMINADFLNYHENLYKEMLFNTNWDYRSGFLTLNWFSNSNLNSVLVIFLFVAPLLLFYKNKSLISSYISFLLFLFGLTYLADRYFAPRYIYYAFPFYILIFSSSIYFVIKLNKSLRKLRFFYLILSLIIIISLFSPLNAINGVIKEKNGNIDSKTELVHYDIAPLFNFLQQNNFSDSDILITAESNIFVYYFNYTFLKDDSDPLRRYDYLLNNFGYPMDSFTYDYATPYEYYYLPSYSYTHKCRDSVCDLNEMYRINKIIEKYSSGWIIIDKDRNRNWNEDGFPLGNYKIGNKTVSYLISTEGYRGFNVYSWTSI